MTDKPSVLFVCVHNAGRSQMTAALLSHMATPAHPHDHIISTRRKDPPCRACS